MTRICSGFTSLLDPFLSHSLGGLRTILSVDAAADHSLRDLAHYKRSPYGCILLTPPCFHLARPIGADIITPCRTAVRANPPGDRQASPPPPGSDSSPDMTGSSLQDEDAPRRQIKRDSRRLSGPRAPCVSKHDESPVFRGHRPTCRQSLRRGLTPSPSIGIVNLLESRTTIPPRASSQHSAVTKHLVNTSRRFPAAADPSRRRKFQRSSLAQPRNPGRRGRPRHPRHRNRCFTASLKYVNVYAWIPESKSTGNVFSYGTVAPRAEANLNATGTGELSPLPPRSPPEPRFIRRDHRVIINNAGERVVVYGVSRAAIYTCVPILW